MVDTMCVEYDENGCVWLVDIATKSRTPLEHGDIVEGTVAHGQGHASTPPCALCWRPLAGETMEGYLDRVSGWPLHHLCTCGASAHVHDAPHPHGCQGNACAGFVAREETP